jgi:hypothetical protein
MRLSRELLPLSPLVATAMISPPASPVSELKCTVPLFSKKVPCTMCRVLSTFQCKVDCAGLIVKNISGAGEAAFWALRKDVQAIGDPKAKAKNIAAPVFVNPVDRSRMISFRHQFP